MSAETLTIVMVSAIAGEPSYAAGETVTLPVDIARAWVDDGLATYAPVVETAEKVQRVETAVRAGSRRV